LCNHSEIGTRSERGDAFSGASALPDRRRRRDQSTTILFVRMTSPQRWASCAINAAASASAGLLPIGSTLAARNFWPARRAVNYMRRCQLRPFNASPALTALGKLDDAFGDEAVGV